MKKSKSVVEEGSPRLKQLREAANLSQEELARLIDVSVKSISRWETGKHEPALTIRQTKALCRAFGKPLDELPDYLSFPRSHVHTQV